MVTHNEDVGVLVIPGTLRKSSKRSSGLTRIPMGAALTPSPVGCTTVHLTLEQDPGFGWQLDKIHFAFVWVKGDTR